ncbi:hypothetical protein NDU88_006141 [Pleurodeles waltl]|uniref:Uncharacterized protein n=1 Tax=Pleurodeles waltl TaxID=8319 RepID=A0AAV7WZS1_PLEWA|nr:hypothetical protein NDU88_006141 [Pleurodeles waltl]
MAQISSVAQVVARPPLLSRRGPRSLFATSWSTSLECNPQGGTAPPPRHAGGSTRSPPGPKGSQALAQAAREQRAPRQSSLCARYARSQQPRQYRPLPTTGSSHLAARTSAGPPSPPLGEAPSPRAWVSIAGVALAATVRSRLHDTPGGSTRGSPSLPSPTQAAEEQSTPPLNPG